MRMTLVLAAAACAVLAGCDQAPPPAVPPPPQGSVLPPAPPPAAVPPPMEERHVEVRHRHHRAWHEGYAEMDSSQSDTSEYGYVSDSHVESTEVAARGRASVQWTDGYGRPYDAPPARRAGTMSGKRLKAWAHYDEDCDR